MKMMYMFTFYINANMDGTDIDISHVSTRSNSGPIFNIEHPNSMRFLKSISYVLRSEWNSLPNSFRNFEDFEPFKLSIKIFCNER